MQEKINVDTVGMLLTLQGMMLFALWGASKVDGVLAVIGYAAACFPPLVLLLAFSLKEQALKPKDRK